VRPLVPLERVSLFRPVIREEAVEAVAEVLRSGWLGMGPVTAEFEREFAAYVGGRSCVALSSCSAGIHLALTVLDLPRDAEVVTTPLTFVSANQAILHAGLRPVFADVEPWTGNLDIEAVVARIGPRTGAILATHYGGYPCDLDALYAVAGGHGVAVVHDCAHACGAVYRGRRVGSHRGMHAFSFQAVKNLPMADGGALIVESEEHERRLRRLRWFGIDSDTHSRTGDGYRWDYRVEELGFKYQLNDVQAAIGLAQLRWLDEDNVRRADIADRYRHGLDGLDGIELLRYEDDRRSSNHLFCVLAERRDDLVRRLAEAKVDVGVHYRPSYDYPLFEGDPLPNVERFWRRVISLPMHVGLTDTDVDRVIGSIAEGW
jgi:perosamine synthetase